MTRRHVRAIAVFAIVLVTLTGARRSDGGGCDDDGGSSSSSSSSGGFTTGGDSSSVGGDSGTTGGDSSTTFGSSSSSSSGTSSGTSTTTTGSSTTSSPGMYDTNGANDIRITGCDYDETSKQLTSDLVITNPSTSDTFSYSVVFKWENSATGESMGTDFLTATVGPGQSQNLTADWPYLSYESVNFQCKVDSAKKYRTS
ncbi:hypothetical protein [Streptomyces capparidis]